MSILNESEDEIGDNSETGEDTDSIGDLSPGEISGEIEVIDSAEEDLTGKCQKEFIDKDDTDRDGITTPKTEVYKVSVYTAEANNFRLE